MPRPLSLTHEQQQEIASRIVGILDRSAVHQEVTPLFLRMVCDHYLRQLQDASRDLNTPLCFAEVVTECIALQLRSIHISETDARSIHLPTLSALARSMLRMDFKPRDIPFEEARKILQHRTQQPAAQAEAILKVYLDSGVLKIVGISNQRLTFFHDNITEYLAAQHFVDECDGNPAGWPEVIAWLERAASGQWPTVRGIISALEDTVSGYFLRGQRGEVRPWLKAWLLLRLEALRVAVIWEPAPAASPHVSHLTNVLTKLQQEGAISVISEFAPSEYAALRPHEQAGFWLAILTTSLPTSVSPSPQSHKVLWHGERSSPDPNLSSLPHGAALEPALRAHLEAQPPDVSISPSSPAARQLLLAKKDFLEKERVLACDPEIKFSLEHRIEEIDKMLRN
jgi:hypothetical protein